MFRLCIASILVMTTSQPAFAAVVGSFVEVPSEAGIDPPAGFVTSDLMIDASTDWLAANLIVELTNGSLYQNSLLVGFGPPSPGLVNIVPLLRFDTFITGSAGMAGDPPSSAGGAVDLGGDSLAQFDGDGININWFTTTTNDVGSFSIGRFTLSDDAVGTFSLRLDSTAQTSPFFLTGSIQGGQFVAVPEVSTMTSLSAVGWGIACVLIVRRRWANVARPASVPARDFPHDALTS